MTQDPTDADWRKEIRQVARVVTGVFVFSGVVIGMTAAVAFLAVV